MSAYYEWRGFEAVYFEDSFVLDITSSKKEITFTLEIVLQESHSLYETPKQNEQYCYKKGLLVFKNIQSVEWNKEIDKNFTDLAGEKDLGNIDEFKLNDKVYELSGDWGILKVISSPVELIF